MFFLFLKLRFFQVIFEFKCQLLCNQNLQYHKSEIVNKNLRFLDYFDNETLSKLIFYEFYFIKNDLAILYEMNLGLSLLFNFFIILKR